MEITENRLIERIARFGKTAGHILRGIGDDGAVVDLDDGSYVFVQDALVEDIHFDLAIQKPYDVGKKAVYINVSDILAMGAVPLYYLVTIGIPKRVASSDIDGLYRGMDRAAKKFGIALLGGDTTETSRDFFIDVSMTGRLIVPEYLGRNKARTNDLLAVTGPLGESAYGLHSLREGTGSGSNRYEKRYKSPEPPVEAWRALIEAEIPRAMMDISDGLLIDLERMMKESGKAAIIHLEEVPMPGVLRREGKELLALAGGEDYQFLFTFDRSRRIDVESLKNAHPQLSVIGEIVSGKGVKLLDKGKERDVSMKGYQHFRHESARGAHSAGRRRGETTE
jgi:thiamine-monophosphate kinase